MMQTIASIDTISALQQQIWALHTTASMCRFRATNDVEYKEARKYELREERLQNILDEMEANEKRRREIKGE